MEQGAGRGSSGGSNQKSLPRGVLARSGLPLPAGARLSSSIRAPRDLTLGGGKVGGPPRKSLAPNLTPKSNPSSTTNGSEERGSGRGRREGGEPRGKSGRGRGGRGGSSEGGRGRGRGRGANLVQLDGIFEAGAAAPGGSWSGGGGGGGGTASGARDTSLPKYIPMEQEDCEDTKETINRLTRADFVDYGDNEEEAELPLMIPLTTARYGTTCKVEDFTEDATSDPHEVSTEDPSSQDSAMETGDGEIVTESKKPFKVTKPVAEVDPSVSAQRLLTMLCLAQNSTKADDEGKNLTVFQLPRLPGPSKASQEEERRVPLKDSKNAKTQNETSQQYKLKDLSKGYLGKLQVLRDGRVRMISGKITMELQMASELPLYQEIVEIQNRMVIPLAKVENKVVCRLNPDDLIGEDTKCDVKNRDSGNSGNSC